LLSRQTAILMMDRTQPYMRLPAKLHWHVTNQMTIP